MRPLAGCEDSDPEHAGISNRPDAAILSGDIYINDNRKWPLQTLLRQMLKSIDISTFGADTISQLRLLSDRSFRGAMIIFATIPILCVYPFMQKHFVAGITIGSVKE